MTEKIICKKCRDSYQEGEEDDDNYRTGLCYHCFEDGVEEHEIRKRERIARQNEY